MTKIISNMGGAKTTEIELKEIVKVIRKLNLIEIDKFWYDLGWIDSDSEKGKALPDWRVEKIKNNEEFAETALSILFQESYKNEFLKKFDEIRDKEK